jgi:acyl-CoA thioesterase I
VIAHVSGADAVEVEVGANDVAHSSACGSSLDCYTPEIPQMEKNLTTIVARVRELTAGHRVLVALLDYWSVWLGGAYAVEQGEASFKGPDYSYDETHYLSDDGDHPNAAGHRQIATAAVDVIESTLHS